MKHQASCCCGQLSLEYDDEISKSSICHCFACQQRTGSIYGVQVGLKQDKVSITGESTKYERTGDSGSRIEYHFCPKCGTTLYWTIDAVPGAVMAAAGAFCDLKLPAPSFSVYEERMHPWVTLPDSVVEHMD